MLPRNPKGTRRRHVLRRLEHRLQTSTTRRPTTCRRPTTDRADHRRQHGLCRLAALLASWTPIAAACAISSRSSRPRSRHPPARRPVAQPVRRRRLLRAAGRTRLCHPQEAFERLERFRNAAALPATSGDQPRTSTPSACACSRAAARRRARPDLRPRLDFSKRSAGAAPTWPCCSNTRRRSPGRRLIGSASWAPDYPEPPSDPARRDPRPAPLRDRHRLARASAKRWTQGTGRHAGDAEREMDPAARSAITPRFSPAHPGPGRAAHGGEAFPTTSPNPPTSSSTRNAAAGLAEDPPAPGATESSRSSAMASSAAKELGYASTSTPSLRRRAPRRAGELPASGSASPPGCPARLRPAPCSRPTCVCVRTAMPASCSPAPSTLSATTS